MVFFLVSNRNPQVFILKIYEKTIKHNLFKHYETKLLTQDVDQWFGSLSRCSFVLKQHVPLETVWIWYRNFVGFAFRILVSKDGFYRSCPMPKNLWSLLMRSTRVFFDWRACALMSLSNQHSNLMQSETGKIGWPSVAKEFPGSMAHLLHTGLNLWGEIVSCKFWSSWSSNFWSILCLSEGAN